MTLNYWLPHVLCFSLVLNVCFFFLYCVGIFHSQKTSSSSSLSAALVVTAKNNNTNNNDHLSFREITSNYKNASSGKIHLSKDSNFTYGLIHFAKTAGTEINGRLAHDFHRVCGQKGYSYDYYQVNQRAKIIQARSGGTVTTREVRRGGIPEKHMDEIGYEDCDYISMERPWNSWKSDKLHWANLELHVPCRHPPIDHLMSQCAKADKQFHCTSASNLTVEIESCILFPDRFSLELELEPNIDLRCFDPIPVDKYVLYMSERLQGKKHRKPSTFVHRETIRERGTSNNTTAEECIWKQPELQKRVLDILIQNYDYYKFCNQCMGSTRELNL